MLKSGHLNTQWTEVRAGQIILLLCFLFLFDLFCLGLDLFFFSPNLFSLKFVSDSLSLASSPLLINIPVKDH